MWICYVNVWLCASCVCYRGDVSVGVDDVRNSSLVNEPPTASSPLGARVCRGCPAGTHECATECKMTLRSERQLVRACVALVVSSSGPEE